MLVCPLRGEGGWGYLKKCMVCTLLQMCNCGWLIRILPFTDPLSIMTIIMIMVVRYNACVIIDYALCGQEPISTISAGLKIQSP